MMLVHQFKTELDKSDLAVLFKKARVPIVIRQEVIWTTEAGFVFVSLTLTLNDVRYEHTERHYRRHYPQIKALLN